MTPILAHAGGPSWDEFLLIVPLPVLLVVLILFAVRARRARPVEPEQPVAGSAADRSAPATGRKPADREPDGNTAS